LSNIIRPVDVIEDMLFDLTHGLEKGTTTYVAGLDEAWTWRNTEVNLWSGYANEGKSAVLRYLCLIKALEEGKKFNFYAPEDAPAKGFFDDMIHTLSGRSTDKSNSNFIGVDMYKKCYELIKDLFSFTYIKPPLNTVENIIKEWSKLYQEGVYGFIIDPHVRVTRDKNAPDRDDLYAQYMMSLLTDFGRSNEKSSLHAVLHQQTPKRTEEGFYPPPNMYAVKGGGTYADMADNVMSVWRPKYAKDKLDTEVKITSQKIKKQKLVGIPQELKFRFNRKTNRFVDFNNPDVDLYDFNKWIQDFKPKFKF
jgi:twinkle protein